MKKVILQTERLTLRPLGVCDLQTTHEYASDKDTTKYMVFLPNNTIEETEEFLQEVEKNWQSDHQKVYEFAICLAGKHIGAISLALEDDSVAEIGWIINAEYHGNGYCTEAAKTITEFAKNIGIKRIVAHCDARNVASYSVMEKLGMTRIGEGPREYLDERGQARELMYQMII